MADPVSWYLIEPGWRVESSDGEEVGRIAEVVGDSTKDIFDGLAVALGMLDKPRYVPAEQVGEIVEGRVRLTLDKAAVESLPAYNEPPEEVAVSGEKAGLGTRLEADAMQAGPRSQHIPLVRRVLLWFGLAGRR
jgi:hypothetical protein